MKLKIKEYKDILKLKDVIPAERGLVSTREGWLETSLRSTEIRWITRDSYSWVFNLMQEYARKAQIELGIDKVLSIKDNIQLSTYYPGDHYGWHTDGRAMSCSLLLSDKFTGGRLEFKEPGWPLLRQAGQAIFFPNVFHRVKPIKSGIRDSLVVWWV